MRIWEARVQSGKLDEMLQWVRRDAIPRALNSPGCLATEVLAGPGEPARVLLITRWDEAPRFEEGSPGPELLRQAGASHFETVH